MKFSPIEIIAGVVGVLIFALAVRPTPVFGAVVVFFICQVIAHAVFVSRRK
jgi:hypothetical protein